MNMKGVRAVIHAVRTEYEWRVLFGVMGFLMASAIITLMFCGPDGWLGFTLGFLVGVIGTAIIGQMQRWGEPGA